MPTTDNRPDAQLAWRLNAIDQLDDRAIARLLRIIGTIGIDPRPRVDSVDRRRLRVIVKGMTQFLETLDAIGDQLDAQ